MLIAKRLPILMVRFIPECVCIRCGQHGYTDEKCSLCCGCFNISLLRFAKKRKAFHVKDFS